MVSFCNSNTNKNSPQTDITLYKGILVEAYIYHFVEVRIKDGIY